VHGAQCQVLLMLVLQVRPLLLQTTRQHEAEKMSKMEEEGGKYTEEQLAEIMWDFSGTLLFRWSHTDEPKVKCSWLAGKPQGWK
jgi:hypothetical protein